MNIEDLRKQIIGAQDLKSKTVEVPEWGCSVILQELSGIARDRVEDMSTTSKLGLRTMVVAHALVDEKGNRVFVTPADMEALGKKNGAVLSKLFEVAWELCGLGTKAVDEAGKD